MTTERYNARDARARWQKFWTAGDLRDRTRIRADTSAGDVPLSVGRIHMGHVRNYNDGDVVARYRGARASTCCTRWAGTPSGCRPRSRHRAKISPRAWTYQKSTL